MIYPSRAGRWLGDVQRQARDRGAFVTIKYRVWPYSNQPFRQIFVNQLGGELQDQRGNTLATISYKQVQGVGPPYDPTTGAQLTDAQTLVDQYEEPMKDQTGKTLV